MMRPFFEHELTASERYFTSLSGHVAAGYVCGSRESMAWLGAEFARTARETLSAGFAASDEQLLPVLASSYPKRFEFHHGAYDQILANYLVPHGGADNLSLQLRVWREQDAPGEGAGLAEAVLASVAAGDFNADPESLALLLDDCYVAAWYGETEPHSLARRIADLYLERAVSDPAFREAFLRNEIHIRKNFSFAQADY